MAPDPGAIFVSWSDREAKMDETLAELFTKAKAGAIDWCGAPVYAIYELDPAPSDVVLEFLGATQAPTQGLCLKVDAGVLQVNGAESRELLLWTDSAPPTVRVRVREKTGSHATLKFWNIWRGHVGGSDVTQAWLGNAGMRIEPDVNRNQFLLRRGDGVGAVNFEDLHVRMRRMA